MSDQPKHRTSALDEETLKALQAAEAGMSSPLLDERVLADTDFLDDNTPLVRRDQEDHIAPPTPEPATGGTQPPGRRPRRAFPTRPRPAPVPASSMADAPRPQASTPPPTPAEEEKRRPEAPEPETFAADSSDNAHLSDESSNQERPAGDPDETLSQEDLDALLTAQETDLPGDDAEGTDADTDAPPSQEDLDAPVAEQAGEARPEVAEDADTDAPLSQEDLDAPVAEQADETPPEDAEDTDTDAPPSQEDLDAPVAEQAGEAPQEDAEDADSDAPLSQEDLDAPVAEQAGETPPEDAEDADTDAPLSQEDLDALVAEQAGDPQAETGDESDSGTISQEDMEALLNASGADDSDKVAGLTDDDLAGLFDDEAERPAPDSPADQTDVDAMLNAADYDQALDGKSLDSPVLSGGGEDDADISLSQSSIDSLMADLDKSGALKGMTDSEEEPEETEKTDEDDFGGISQDMIDSLIASAQQEAKDERGSASQSEVGSENLAAAGTASDAGSDALSQSDLDKLIESSNQQDKGHGKAREHAVEDERGSAQASARGEQPPDETEAEPATRARFKKPGVVVPFIRNHAARLVACLLVGALCASGTGLFMTLNREYRPGMGARADRASLETAMERARNEIADGEYTRAVETLDGPIERAFPSQLRNDALYLRLEAQHRAFRGEWGTEAFDEMAANIDEVLDVAPSHPRAPEALHWKARLYAPEQPMAALDIYKRIFEQYGDAPDMDRMLMEAAKLALKQNDPVTTYMYAQRLLTDYPASPWAGEATLAIGDANARAGNLADARSQYIRLAQEAPDSALGAKAFVRLGRLSYDAGQYNMAEMHLKNRLETSTTLEGNDEVYLLLAQTHRASGQLEQARDTLTDLLSFFQDSPLRPDAFIEYSQVLEALGNRERAVKTAQRAALEFPNHPGVLRNNGEFQGLNGNPLAAAVAFVSADRAGAADPSLLLNAARYYHAANMNTEAAQIYDRLKTNYAGAPEALTGGIEAAELRYEQGDTVGALDSLKSLQAATQGTRHYLPTIEAMQSIYRDLGLDEHIANTAREILAQAQEPETLARAAMDLIDAGDLENARTAIDRVDLGRVPPRTAFDLLMKEGEALLSVAPQRGLEKMEQAYFNYPDARTREADQKLLRTYLNAGRSAAARRMVMDLKAHVAEKPIDTPYLIDAAVAWGDYLYDKEDYRTAVFAYSIAEDAGGDPKTPVSGLHSEPEWARYQRANALLQLADYEGCLNLYEDIAASDSPWAQEAGVKANLARLEQRQRGQAVARTAQAG